jgi:hypothetical protein
MCRSAAVASSGSRRFLSRIQEHAPRRPTGQSPAWVNGLASGRVAALLISPGRELSAWQEQKAADLPSGAGGRPANPASYLLP